MTVAELMEKRQKLEEDITRQIESFTKETGVDISNVDVSMHSCIDAATAHYKYVMGHVKVFLAI